MSWFLSPFSCCFNQFPLRVCSKGSPARCISSTPTSNSVSSPCIHMQTCREVIPSQLLEANLSRSAWDAKAEHLSILQELCFWGLCLTYLPIYTCSGGSSSQFRELSLLLGKSVLECKGRIPLYFLRGLCLWGLCLPSFPNHSCMEEIPVSSKLLSKICVGCKDRVLLLLLLELCLERLCLPCIPAHSCCGCSSDG